MTFLHQNIQARILSTNFVLKILRSNQQSGVAIFVQLKHWDVGPHHH